MRIVPLITGFFAVWLAACSPVASQTFAEDAAFIEITQGSHPQSETLRIYANDRLELRLGHPTNATSISDGATGSYNRAAHYLAAEGPVVAQNLADAPVCPDWGEITIRAVPAVAGISRIRAGCPDTMIEPLRDQLLGIVGR